MPVVHQGEIRVLHVGELSLTVSAETYLEQDTETFAVETVPNASDGLSAINDRPPDCVVLECDLPSIDAVEFVEVVREQHPNLPVILLSDNSIEDIAIDALAAGATDFVQSVPEQYGLLANRVRNAVERYRSEHRLNDIREEYTTLFENAQNGLLLVDVEDDGFRYRKCNPRAAELIGRDREEITGKRPSEALGPDNEKHVVGAYRKCIDTCEPVEYVITIELPVGEVIRECKVTSVSTEGNIEQLVVTFHDVTDQVERQRELERYDRIIENVPVGVFRTTLDGDLTSCNEQLVEIYDAESKRELAAVNVEGLYSDPNGRGRLYSQLEATGTVEDERLRVETLDGEQKWVQTSITLVEEDGDQYLDGVIEDVTAQVEHKKGLEEWQRSVERALDTLDELFYVLDTDGTFRRWNAQFSEVTGYSDSELGDMHAIEVLPEEEHQTVSDSIEKVLAGEQVTVEADILTDSEERKPYEFTGHQMTDADGDVGGLVGVGRDLTEIREQQRRFRALTEQSPDIISVVDAEAKFQYASPSWRQLGYDPEELVGDVVWDYVHPDDRAELIEQFEAALTDPDMNPVAEFRVEHADGSWQWLEARGNNQLGNPAVEGYVVNKRDITERKEREAELQRQHDRLAAVYDAVPHVITEVEFQDGEPIVQNVNNSFYDVFGYSREQVIGESLDEFIIPEEHREEAASVNQSAQNGEAIEREVERVTADGERRMFLFRSAKISREDQTRWLGTYVDITERKESEQTLKRKQEFLEQTQEVASVGGWEVNLQTGTQRWTDGVYQIHGIPLDENITIEEGISFYHPEDRDTIQNAFERLMADGEPYDLELRIMRTDDEVRWVRTRGEPQYNQDGEIIGAIGTFHDITERKERQRELRRKETVFENTQDSVFLIDVVDESEFRILRVNPSYREATGFTNEDIQGKTLGEIFGEGEGRRIDERYRECVERNEPIEYDETLTIDGEATIWETTVAPVEEGGTVEYLVGATRDVTEKRERSQELLRKNWALENAPVGVTMTDPNQEDNPIIFANEKFEEITGYSESETYGRNHRYLQGKRTDSEPVAKMREAIDEHEQVSVELRNYRKDGTEFWNRNAIAPVFDKGGDLVNFVGFQQDVTDRKQREQQIQVFNRILRHNLRNRLHVARAHLMRVARERQKSVGPGEELTDKADLKPAVDSVQDLIDISEKAKKLNRAMSMNSESQEIELDSYLSRLVADVRESFPDASISFDRSEEVVLSAFSSLRVALQELLTNAAKHAGPDPSISVVIEEKDETVEIQISDNGPGLTEQDRQVLAERGETPLMHGSGLGLWMVSWIVTTHGGSVDADASQEGTTVTVSLPQSSTETASISVVSEPELQQARNRFETIFEESFDSMVITDADGSYIEVNTAATELFGRTEQQLHGCRLEEFADDLDRPQVGAAMETGRERSQFTLVWPDGTERFVEYSVTPNIVPEQHLFVFRDVTDRRRREEALTARTQELERQNDRLNEFASVVSHDLRNPLNVATKQLEQARRECDSDHLANVATAHRRMDELISDVLDLARAGQELGDIEQVQLTTAVAQCWQTVESMDASLAIKTDCQVRANPSRFRQLVENLLRNAIEHCGDDVSITVSQREDGDGFYVADDGPGIPDDELDSIFESGYSTEREGTGFGLAIVDEIVDAHGWSIQVSESLHGGARFDITNMSE